MQPLLFDVSGNPWFFRSSNPTVCLTQCFCHSAVWKRCRAVLDQTTHLAGPAGYGFTVVRHHRIQRSRPPFGRRTQQRTKRRHCSCVEMSICLQVMMIISCKLSGPHYKFRLRARRAAPTAAAFPPAWSPRPATSLRPAFHPHSTLANVLGHLVSRLWDEVWTTLAIDAGLVAAPTPPRTKLPTTAHHAPVRRRITPLNPCPWDIALNPAARVCGSLTIFFPVGQVDS